MTRNEELVKEYLTTKYSQVELGEMFGMHRANVNALLKKMLGKDKVMEIRKIQGERRYESRKPLILQ